MIASEYWVSKAAGDLLVLASRVGNESSALRRVFRDNVDSCVSSLFNGNGAEFAKFVGLPGNVPLQLAQREDNASH